MRSLVPISTAQGPILSQNCVPMAPLLTLLINLVSLKQWLSLGFGKKRMSSYGWIGDKRFAYWQVLRYTYLNIGTSRSRKNIIRKKYLACFFSKICSPIYKTRSWYYCHWSNAGKLTLWPNSINYLVTITHPLTFPPMQRLCFTSVQGLLMCIMYVFSALLVAVNYKCQ